MPQNKVAKRANAQPKIIKRVKSFQKYIIGCAPDPKY